MNSEGAARRTGRCPSRASAATEEKESAREDCPLVSICLRNSISYKFAIRTRRQIAFGNLGIASVGQTEPYLVGIAVLILIRIAAGRRLRQHFGRNVLILVIAGHVVGRSGGVKS